MRTDSTPSVERRANAARIQSSGCNGEDLSAVAVAMWCSMCAAERYRSATSASSYGIVTSRLHLRPRKSGARGGCTTEHGCAAERAPKQASAKKGGGKPPHSQMAWAGEIGHRNVRWRRRGVIARRCVCETNQGSTDGHDFRMARAAAEISGASPKPGSQCTPDSLRNQVI